MTVGILHIDILVSDSSSLKDKRRILRRLKDRIKNKFNISVAEVDNMNKWQKTSLGIAVVSSDRKHVSSYLDGIVGFIENENRLMVLDYATEIL